PGLGHIRDERQWRRYLQAQYGRYWKVHFAKKTRGAWHSVKYLGRYLPQHAMAEIDHTAENDVIDALPVSA
ncbi:transposase, partial [Candidatus Erwinia dacicola]